MSTTSKVTTEPTVVNENPGDKIIAGQTWVQQSINFCDWMQEEGPHLNKGPYTARFTRAKADYRIAMVYDVERYCIKNFDNLHTVWLSLNACEKDESGHWADPVKHYDGYHSSALCKALRRTVESHEYVGLSLHAPRQTGYTHRHVAIWVDGKVTQKDFEPFIDSFVRNHPTARAKYNQYEDAIKVKKVTPGDLSHLPQGVDLHTEAKRGRTTKFPREIASNIEALSVTNDLQQADRNVRMWGALLWATDRRAWQPLGGRGGRRFKEYAQLGRERRLRNSG